ncbi:lymphocyte activation gene 3 protein-like [Osmerus mordax]|uniref:lymphocyte activation gene 3 protein-like n=1 Tax=Osmerus mordax TaxID=8014 RepID=UPI00350F3F5B
MSKMSVWQYLSVLGATLLVTGVWCESTEVFVEVGSQAILPCVSRPPPHTAAVINWSRYHGGTIWRKKKSGLEYWDSSAQRVRCSHSHTGDYSLYIKEVREEDAGEYRCRVEDGKQLIIKNIILRVIKASFSPKDPLDGDTLSIACGVKPWPWGATVSWRLNGEPFLVHDHGFTEENFASGPFYLKGRASGNVTGNWTCAVHQKGREATVTRALTVRGIVSPSRDSSRVYAAVGSAVTLPCVFTSGLAPSGVLWERTAKGSLSASAVVPILPPSANLSSTASQAPWDRSVVVAEVGVEDGGGYRCSGSVTGKKLGRGMHLVTAQVLRNSPTSRRAPVTLTCHLSDASEVTDYSWVQLTPVLNGTQSAIPFPSNGKVLNIGAVTEKTAGEWACLFYGKQGMLGNVTYDLQLMSGLSGVEETSSGAGPAVGLVLLLLIALLVVVQMCKNEQRKRNILRFPALETIVHAHSNEREDSERSRVKDDEISK